MTTMFPAPDPNLSNQLRSTGSLPNTDARFSSIYRLDSSVVDLALARKLYYNTDPRYKLGAGFSRPAINLPVGFMGIPRLHVEDKTSDAQEWLNRSLDQWSGDIIKAHKMASRDGEVLVRLRPMNRSPAYAALYGKDDKDLELALIPSEAFEIISKDEDLDAIEAVKIKHVFLRPDSGGNMQEVVLYEMVSANEIVLEFESHDEPTRRMPNPLGFVPAVHLTNEPEMHQLHASSDLEPIEPYMKFYHDVMLHAGSASALHSTAKLVLRAQDVGRFLQNNFTQTEIDSKRLRFKNKDVLFFESGTPDMNTSGGANYREGAEIIQARAPLGDTTTLLEFIFLNIVDVSEVPEWAFGGAIASSKASVSEQGAPLIHKVARKRNSVENAWALIGRMMLKVVTAASVRVTVDWSTLAMRDLKTEAEAFRNYTESLIALNDAGSVSKITVNEILSELNTGIIPFGVDGNKTEEARISAEVAERQAVAQALVDNQREMMEDDDREAGLRAVR